MFKQLNDQGHWDKIYLVEEPPSSFNTCKYFEYVKFKLKVYLFRFSTNTEKLAYILFFFKYFLQIKCILFHFIFIKKYWNLHICALGGVASKMQFCPIFHTFAKP